MKKSKLHLLREHFKIYKDKAGKDIRENSTQRADTVRWHRKLVAFLLREISRIGKPVP